MDKRLKYFIFTLFVIALCCRGLKLNSQSEHRVCFYDYYTDIPDSFYSISCKNLEQYKGDTVLCIFAENRGYISFDFLVVSSIGTSSDILKYAIRGKQYISICGRRFLFVIDRLFTENTGFVFSYTGSDFTLRRFVDGRFEVIK